MNIADRLRVLREANNLTQDDLAHKLGLSRSTISKYEIADRGPDIETLINICEIYNITLEEFFKEEIENKPTIKSKSNKIIGVIISSIVTTILLIIFSINFVTPKHNYGYDISNAELRVNNSEEIAVIQFLTKENKDTYKVNILESLKGDNFEYVSIKNKDIEINLDSYYLILGNKLAFNKEMKNYLSIDCVEIYDSLFIEELVDYSGVNFLNDNSKSSTILNYYSYYIKNEKKDDIIISTLKNPRKSEYVINNKDVFSNPYDVFDLNKDFNCDIPTLLDDYYEYADIEITMKVKDIKGMKHYIGLYNSIENNDNYRIAYYNLNLPKESHKYSSISVVFKTVNLESYLNNDRLELFIRYGAGSLFSSSWVNSDINVEIRFKKSA